MTDSWADLDNVENLRLWQQMGDWIMNNRSSDHVMVWNHLVVDDSLVEVDLNRTMMKVVLPGSMPIIEINPAYGGKVSIWRRKDYSKLLKDERRQELRYIGSDAALFGAPLAFWPPSIELGTSDSELAEGSSACWLVEFPAAPLKSELTELARGLEVLGWKKPTWFRKREFFDSFANRDVYRSLIP